MNNKNKRIALIVVAALIGISIWVVKDFFVGGFSYAGTVEATRIDLPARLATTIKEFLVQEGESVQAEQLLVKLSCEDISLQKNLAQENYDRAVNLKKTGSISKEVFDLAQNKFEDANTRASWCVVK
jgi:HlyD family secretion protein